MRRRDQGAWLPGLGPRFVRMRAHLDSRGFGRTASRSASLMALALVVLAMMTGCAAAPATPPPGELLLAYTRDKEVANDVLDEQPTGSPEDRLANIAAYFSREQLAGFLLGALPCGDRPTVTYSYRIRDLGCPVPPPVVEAAAGAAGGQQILVRAMIVRHPDGRLELMPLYVAGSGAGALLVTRRARPIPVGSRTSAATTTCCHGTTRCWWPRSQPTPTAARQ